jgi:DnaK suppressor protein
MEALKIQEFELQLQEMKKELESNIVRLNEEMEAIVTDDSVNDIEDMASLESESMHHTALLKQQRHELSEVKHALEKIKVGTYGICEKSGDLIEVERLRAKPHTRYCLKDAQRVQQ